jgi:hypothetical protein
VIDGGVSEEACPHDLAPTASTTVALGIGDALAVALLERKGFRREDFAALHPGGSLGLKLTLRVRDVMLNGDGTLPPGATMREAVVTLARHRGMASIVDQGRLVGVITGRGPDPAGGTEPGLSGQPSRPGDDPDSQDRGPRRVGGGRGRNHGASTALWRYR